MENRTETQRSLLNYLEPAVFVTVLAASLYYIGISREWGFLVRLGIRDLFGGGDPIYYVRSSPRPIANFVWLSMVPLIIVKLTQWILDPRTIQTFATIFPENRMLITIERFLRSPIVANRVELLLPNSIFLILIWIFADWSQQSYSQDSELNIVYLEVAAACLVALLYYIARGQKFHEAFVRGSFLERTFIILLLLIASQSFAYKGGGDEAVRLIEKKASPSFLIDFKWKTAPPTELAGKELLLIMHRDGKYFVVPPQNPAPKYPTSYIIHDDQVEFATTRAVK